MDSFEVFDKRTLKATQTPYVTIQRKGTISLNKAAFKELHEPDAVELLFNRGERIIGLRPIDAKAPHSFPVRSQVRAGNYLVAGRAFTVHYGIDTGTARRYLARFRNGMLIVDLREQGADATGPRAKDAAKPNIIDFDSQRA